MKKSLSLILFFLVVSTHSYASLDWNTTKVSQEADPSDSEITAVFRFANIGDDAVTITEVKPSCGCTTTELDKKTYEPGEVGKIEATLKIGSRKGVQTKTIRVSTKGEEKPTVLTMETVIPDLLNIRPAFVFWKKGEVPDGKTIELKVGIEEPIKVLSAESNNGSIEVHLEEIEEGRSYQLHLFPTQTDEAARARITLSTDYPVESPRTYYVYAHIK
ncbi:DUF1573 domain-containing protein [Puniceicoccus vermicola]|uniref:DUF1573 domain-containing protein n=1 Tax=Puniceicoccus vermicola TaxID=388746 RepID=A0A7X1AZZ1_9BACT|nr:DUF1573 domain-containing protein [Puniceicoccus vermicola]MBC2603042.1 DUF1573 domain-containing protein [Puniceicoccus vermicola]